MSTSKIVFERNGDLIDGLPLGIFTINPDGSNCVQIRSTRNGGAPEWSPNGKWIAFHEVPKGYEFYASNIHIMGPNGGEIKQLTFHKDCAAACPTWSPDSTKIVYCIWKDQAHQVCIVDIESIQQKQLTFEFSNGYPVWIPSNRIVFQREDSSTWKIYIMDIEGKNQREYSIFQPGDLEPMWSRDGTKIVFVRDSKIGVMDSDGNDLLMIPNVRGPIEVSWSPDAKEIVYSQIGISSGQEIYAIDLKGENKRKIVANPFGPNGKEVGSCDVCWSPWLEKDISSNEKTSGRFQKPLFNVSEGAPQKTSKSSEGKWPFEKYGRTEIKRGSIQTKLLGNKVGKIEEDTLSLGARHIIRGTWGEKLGTIEHRLTGDVVLDSNGKEIGRVEKRFWGKVIVDKDGNEIAKYKD